MVMKYAAYKQHYADCTTVPGTYNPVSKTIEVIVPDGRMKASGTRGQRYNYYRFSGVNLATGRAVELSVKAITHANAVKQLPQQGYTWDIT